MRQLSLASQGSFEKYRKKTRREEFLEEMDRHAFAAAKMSVQDGLAVGNFVR